MIFPSRTRVQFAVGVGGAMVECRSNQTPTRGVGSHDARVRRITLTGAGRALVDELIEVHLDTERRLLSGFAPEQTHD